MAGYKNSFSGIIDEIPEISVDNFANYDKRAYFLSHCHTDHTNGLFFETFLENLVKKDSYVYMSEPSAIIIMYEKSDCRLEKHIRPLKLGSTTILIPQNEAADIILNVTLIPAGHCLGSVMMLFKTNNNNILYTGDFRINSNDISKYTHFHVDGDSIHINTLYIDTTFQNLEYENFPKRSESVDYAVSEISKWLQLDDNNRIALNTSANYGYEYVFNEIYKQLKVKVYVNDEKWRLYSMLQKQVPGVTNNMNDTRIHCCRNRHATPAHMTCYPNEDKNKYNYLYIRLSAMVWRNYELDTPLGERDNNSLRILFATHCSRRELQCFVNYFQPKRIVGFPKPFVESPKLGESMDIKLKRKVSPRKCTKGKEAKRKVDSNLLREIFD